jgi:hypothetical protein
MNKFAQALLLSLVIAAPVAISVSDAQAEAAVSSITPAVSSATNSEVAIYRRRRPVYRHYRRPVYRHYRRPVYHHHM